MQRHGGEFLNNGQLLIHLPCHGADGLPHMPSGLSLHLQEIFVRDVGKRLIPCDHSPPPHVPRALCPHLQGIFVHKWLISCDYTVLSNARNAMARSAGMTVRAEAAVIHTYFPQLGKAMVVETAMVDDNLE